MNHWVKKYEKLQGLDRHDQNALWEAVSIILFLFIQYETCAELILSAKTGSTLRNKTQFSGDRNLTGWYNMLGGSNNKG